jgi:hypothetical protein
VGYRVRCPDPEHEPPCRYTAVVPGGTVRHASGTPGAEETVVTATVRLETDWPELPAAVRALVDDADGLDFMHLPPDLRYDEDFIRRSGLADCAGAARMLVRAAADRGVRARESSGLIIAPLHASRHYWLDVQVGDRWVPVDPILINAMLGWGIVHSPQWTPYRSPGAVLCRVSDPGVPMVTHDGVPVPVALPTRPSTAGGC